MIGRKPFVRHENLGRRSVQISTATATSSHPSSTSTSTIIEITSQEDIDSLPSQCSGSLNITTSDIPNLYIDNLLSVGGDLIVENAENMESISAARLESIGGALRVMNQVSVTSIEMLALSSMNILHIVNNTSLNDLKFSNAGVANLSDIWIENTTLSSIPQFSGSNQMIQISFMGNPQLAKIEVWAEKVRDVTLLNNDEGLNASFPTLQNAEWMTIQNASSISLPSLQTISTWNASDFFQGIVISGNSQLTELEMPALESVEAMVVSGNPKLTELGMPALKSVMGLMSISGNNALNSLSMPVLRSVNGNFTLSTGDSLDILELGGLSMVDGTMEVDGLFSNISIPNLEYVQYGIKVNASYDCQEMNSNFTNNSQFNGNFSCIQSNQKKLSATTTTSPPSSSLGPTSSNTAPPQSPSSASSGTWNASRSGLIGGISVAVIITICIVISIVYHRRYRVIHLSGNGPTSFRIIKKTGIEGKAELMTTERVGELSGEKEIQELDASKYLEKNSREIVRHELEGNDGSS